MVYNPAFSNPSDWDNELVSDTKLNQMKDNTEHNYKYKPEGGPDIGSDNYKIAHGIADITYPGGTGFQSITVTFATDSDFGDPGFTTAPLVVVGDMVSPTGLSVTAGNIDCPYVGDITSTECKIYSNINGNPDANDIRRISWIAIGV
jgi:hypothetical protein